MNTDYDILIIGAGMVGASLALALRGQALRIGLIEAVPFDSNSQPSYDARTTALSQGTQRIFQGMHVWERLQDHATPIKKIHVSDQGHFGFTRLDCADQGVEALGYVVENAALGRVFAEALAAQSNVDLICPAAVQDIQIDHGLARVSLSAEAQCNVTARLVVLADGRKSSVRERLGIGSREHSYGQQAIITNITPEHAHGNVAYERFTPRGSLALLPMGEQRCAVVWSLPDAQADAVMALDDPAFLARLQDEFGGRLGRLQRAGRRHAYPLMFTRSCELVRSRLALIGNAAHSLHPIAGQGFNLGLRDVAVLAQTLVDAARQGRDIGDLTTLQDYSNLRRRDQRGVSLFTDALVRVFAQPFAPLACARNLGMLALDLLPSCKHSFAKQGMGLSGWQPRLTRGLAL